MDVLLYSLAAMAVLAAGLGAASARVVQQFERGVVFRLGRVQPDARGPGLTMLIPVVDRMTKVNMQVVTMPVPAQDGITRDNVTVRVDAVVYFRVVDPVARRRQGRRTTRSRSPRWRRPRCGRSSARASWTTCCPTASSSTRASR